MNEQSENFILSAEHLFKTYVLPGNIKVPVLRGASLHVKPGEHVAILGKSGSGKSTLLHLLGGLDKPDRNPETRIRVAGCDLLHSSEHKRAQLRASRIGFVFQSFHLLPELRMEENVFFPSLALPRSQRPAHSRALELLKAVGLGDRIGHYPAELSGGEQQRTAIARALMNGPEMILADEPTGNLDPATGRQILDLLFDLAGSFSQKPPALVMVTHAEEIAARCDRILHLEQGSFPS